MSGKIFERKQAPQKWAMVNTAIEQYVADYECVVEGDGGEATHTPNEFERYLIADAIYGLTADADFVEGMRRMTHEDDLKAALLALTDVAAEQFGEQYMPIVKARDAIAKATGAA